MPFDLQHARPHLQACNLAKLFIEELGWEPCRKTLTLHVAENNFALTALAEKRGFIVWLCESPNGGLPDHSARLKLDRKLSETSFEHLIVFVTHDRSRQSWVWVRREPGKPLAARTHEYRVGQPGDSLLQKLQALYVSLEEDEAGEVSTVTVAGRARAAFDIERVTKSFYRDFDTNRKAFLNFIDGIGVVADREWYASVMLNRLMFVYFIQRKGFLDGDRDYLRNRLDRCQKEQGKDQFYTFYRYFLLRLFHEGFGKRRADRAPDLEKLLGSIPYLNGGLFDVHELEKPERYGKDIQIPDHAFESIFNYFDQYQWHLDERPLRQDNEINPDVLGYIFEKFINQKQMGAYYTKEDITEYISKNTVIPFLVDAARSKCKVAFEESDSGVSPVWELLKENPDRYIYPAVRHGMDKKLPTDIAAGLNTATPDLIERRKAWNKPAPAEYALPTEIWREVVARRQRYEEVSKKLAKGEVREINDFITLNLDLRQFAQDVIQDCEGPDLLMALWQPITTITILDPTGGSGAFIFAALNILDPLYEACLDRMEAFLAEWGESGKKHHPNYHKKFTEVLARVDAHPNRRYFVLKSIILNNLYAVDIMEEAVEICKLRLFLKLAAQVEPDTASDNLGIEPLPDIDFNIRAGNTLVGYATADEVRRCMTSEKAKGADQMRLGIFGEKDAYAAFEDKLLIVDAAARTFRDQQTNLTGTVTPADKRELQKRLAEMEQELNRHLASEYDISSGNKTAYAKWLKSHQPFHWFIQFYGILSKGGFDVIIGNPPYLEYSKVKDYRVQNYTTEECSNLYAFTMERSFALISPEGRVGMIIPISIACSGAMETLRDEVMKATRSVWLSHFSNRPGQLFTGAQNRLSILMTSGKQALPKHFSTRYYRWDARNGERDHLFPVLRYQELTRGVSIFNGLLPKIGCIEAVDSLAKISSNKTVELLKSRQGRYKIYWVRVPGYFCQFLLDPPMARPESGGPTHIRGEVNDISFHDKDSMHVVHAILNSSTYYQFFCVYTDTRHINPSDVAEFPLDLTVFDDNISAKLVDLSAKLAKCFAANTAHWRKSGLLIDSIDSKPCKPIIDKIDAVLAEHYGFTDEELDFIINYDIKYRLGRDVENEDT